MVTPTEHAERLRQLRDEQPLSVEMARLTRDAAQDALDRAIRHAIANTWMPLTRIAEDAGLGRSTLYRRFKATINMHRGAWR